MVLQRLNCQGSCRCADGGVRQFCRWFRSSWGAGWSGGSCLVVRRVADGFPLAAGLAAAQGDGGVGAADGPSHARRFRALSDDRFAACFVGSGADEKATGAEVLVAHAGRVVLEVAQCLARLGFLDSHKGAGPAVNSAWWPDICVAHPPPGLAAALTAASRGVRRWP